MVLGSSASKPGLKTDPDIILVGERPRQLITALFVEPISISEKWWRDQKTRTTKSCQTPRANIRDVGELVAKSGRARRREHTLREKRFRRVAEGERRLHGGSRA